MKRKSVLIVDGPEKTSEALAARLVSFDVLVEMASSAEAALEFITTQTPDAIFMDAGIPGLDEAQASRIIRANPRTATIPVTLYLLKQGDLYLGQARAFGAIGVLPKEPDNIDLEAVLQELHLLPDQTPLTDEFGEHTQEGEGIDETEAVSPSMQTSNVEAINGKYKPQNAIEVSEESLDESVFLLKRQTRIYQQELLQAEKRVLEFLAKEFSRMEYELLMNVNKGLEERTWGGGIIGLLIANLLLLPFLGLFLWHLVTDNAQVTSQHIRDMQVQMVDMVNRAEGLEDRFLTPTPDAPATGQVAANTGQEQVDRDALIKVIQWAANRGTNFEYGDNPYGDSRITWLMELIERLKSVGFMGEVVLKANYGDFCLHKSDTGALVLAPDATPIEECTFSLEADEAGLIQSSYQTIEFANYLNTLTSGGTAAIQVLIEADETGNHIKPYPDKNTVKTAGEWNRIAHQNQRVIVTLRHHAKA